jgi:hypothetical protein
LRKHRTARFVEQPGGLKSVTARQLASVDQRSFGSEGKPMVRVPASAGRGPDGLDQPSGCEGMSNGGRDRFLGTGLERQAMRDGFIAGTRRQTVRETIAGRIGRASPPRGDAERDATRSSDRTAPRGDLDGLARTGLQWRRMRLKRSESSQDGLDGLRSAQGRPTAAGRICEDHAGCRGIRNGLRADAGEPKRRRQGSSIRHRRRGWRETA